jgi:hypothetical protein
LSLSNLGRAVRVEAISTPDALAGLADQVLGARSLAWTKTGSGLEPS